MRARRARTHTRAYIRVHAESRQTHASSCTRVQIQKVSQLNRIKSNKTKTYIFRSQKAKAVDTIGQSCFLSGYDQSGRTQTDLMESDVIDFFSKESTQTTNSCDPSPAYFFSISPKLWSE